MNKDFVDLIDAAVKKGGFSDRSKFIREAILEKLQSLGIEVPAELSAAPERVGKGGRYHPHRPNNLILNSSDTRPLSKAAVSSALAAEKGKARRRPPT